MVLVCAFIFLTKSGLILRGHVLYLTLLFKKRKWLKEYRLRKYAYQHKFLVSLTTSPERLKSISPVLEGFRNVDVVLNVPLLFRHKEPYSDALLDKVIKKFPNVKVHRLQKDLGPQSKLLGTFEFLKSDRRADSKANYERADSTADYDAIVVIDDDTMYEPDMLSRYDNSMTQISKTIFTGQKIYARGFEVAPGCKSYCIPLANYPTAQFIQSSDVYSASSKSCMLHDDMVFAAAFQDIGYKIETALPISDHSDDGIDTIQLPSGFGYDALHTLEHCIVKDNKCSASIWSTRHMCSMDELTELQKNIKGIITDAIDMTMSL